MDCRLLAWLAAFLSFVIAVPSPAAYVAQQPFSPPALPSRPRWRMWSDKFIDNILGLSKSSRHAGLGIERADRQLPAHTLARYGEDIVVRFNVSTPAEAKSLAEAADTLILDIWDFSHDWVDIRLVKDIVAPLLGLLPQSLQKSHTPLLRERELAQAIYDTYPTPRGQSVEAHSAPSHHNARPFSPALHQTDEPEGNIFFSNYQPLSVIEPWMRLLASLFTTHVRKVNIGLSSQGRDISGLRVGVHPTNDDEANPPKRKTILIVGGLHAREWISTSTVNYIAYSLITGYGKTPGITHLLEAFDFVFIPTLNPDGYTYTWSTDRLWRKNRQSTTFRFCQGIDLDRSFGYQWDGNLTTTGNPCSESFAGEEPFEAVETKALADWARNETERNNVEFVGFLDLHSYSQEILYPYSYSCDDTPPGLENLEELAIGLGKAIRISHGHSYEVMPACEGNVAASKSAKRRLLPRMEAAGGSALDYFYHEMRVRYAYQIKLRDRGTYGFLLPKENIVPTGREILGAVLHFGSFLSELYVPERQVQGSKVVTEDESEAMKPRKGDWEGVEQSDEVSDWVWVDDEQALDPEEVQWDLKRRRKR